MASNNQGKQNQNQNKPSSPSQGDQSQRNERGQASQGSPGRPAARTRPGKVDNSRVNSRARAARATARARRAGSSRVSNRVSSPARAARATEAWRRTKSAKTTWIATAAPAAPTRKLGPGQRRRFRPQLRPRQADVRRDGSAIPFFVVLRPHPDPQSHREQQHRQHIREPHRCGREPDQHAAAHHPSVANHFARRGTARRARQREIIGP